MTFSRNNSGTAKIIEFYHDMVKYAPELHSTFDTRMTVNLFAAVISRDMKGQLLKERLLLNAYKVARSVGATSMMWICVSNNDQERARRVGLKVGTGTKQRFKWIYSLSFFSESGPEKLRNTYWPARSSDIRQHWSGRAQCFDVLLQGRPSGSHLARQLFVSRIWTGRCSDGNFPTGD